MHSTEIDLTWSEMMPVSIDRYESPSGCNQLILIIGGSQSIIRESLELPGLFCFVQGHVITTEIRNQASEGELMEMSYQMS